MKRKTIEFGRYLYKNNELREIEWLVLDERPDGKVLLISKNCISAFQYEFRENKNKDPKWENCVIRLWLNSYFLNYYFTAREKERMSEISIETPDGVILNDKVILLSAEEAERYFEDDMDRKAKPTPMAKRPMDSDFAEKDRIYVEKGYCGWFLRDPSEKFKGNFTNVRSDGKIDYNGGDFYYSLQGVRPVILLDL